MIAPISDNEPSPSFGSFYRKGIMMKLKKTFFVGERKIGKNAPVFIIAEAGVAHFGSLEKAFQLVDLARSANADAIKFQMFETDELISSVSSDWKERYQSKYLSVEDFKKIKGYCDEKGIIFFATAHDETSLQNLVQLETPVFKIGSGEVKNWPFLRKIASLHKPVILSTGMYAMEDIRFALQLFSEEKNDEIAVLHCTTAYPTPPEYVNLKAIQTIRKEFDCIVGYSDHTEGYHFPVAAVALGAQIIEKHITLEFNIPNAQDWKVSCGPNNLSHMVNQIRDIDCGLGDGVKYPSDIEIKNMQWGRKSIVAACQITAGEFITPEKIKTKRPGTGIPPEDLGELIGKKAKRFIKIDALIDWEDVE
jgi:N-acetylneuraminate synthase/N,N'-diacetyllegionaminate synthase